MIKTDRTKGINSSLTVKCCRDGIYQLIVVGDENPMEDVTVSSPIYQGK